MGRKLLGAEDGKGVDREEGMGKSDRREREREKAWDWLLRP